MIRNRDLPIIVVFLPLLLMLAGPAAGGPAFSISSSAFKANGDIPVIYTCQGQDISPPLSWSGQPAGTRSLVLIVDDPDAPDPANPKITWVHWLLYNLPPHSNSLPQNVESLPPGTLEGISDFKHSRWGGPCPPRGKHRYFFKLYALDTVLPDLASPDKPALLRAMQGHILKQTQIIGLYRKQ